jgi:polyadenylation factor subunit 2
VSGGWEGSINFWLTDNDQPVASMETAHESSVFALDWHPLGHILVSASNDHTTRFWTRNRPGEALNDTFNLAMEETEAEDKTHNEVHDQSNIY